MSEVTQRRIFRRDPYTSVVAFVISIVAVVTGVISALESDASLRASKFVTLAQTEIIEATRVQTVGAIEANYAWSSAYRLWIENNAQRAFYRDNDKPLEPFLAARERVEELSGLFSESYYDPEDPNSPYLEAYEADLYIREYTYKTQLYKKYQQAVNDWDEKADNYTNYLSWLTLALILLGFSVTIITDARLHVVILLGSLCIIGFSLIETTGNYYAPLDEITDDAIAHYADGAALLHQGDAEGAIAAYTAAIESAPTYTDAYVQRGFVGRLLYDFTGDTAFLEAAAADFEQALADGRTEVNVFAQASEIYYLLGDFERSIALSEAGLQATGDWIHDLDRGRSLLAMGDVPAAEFSYEVGIQNARTEYEIIRDAGGQVPTSFFFNLDVAFLELDYLLFCLQEIYCGQAPPPDTLPPADTIADAVVDLSSQIKTLSASLEFLGEVREEPITAEFEPMEFFVAGTQEPTVEIIGGSQQITVRMAYEGMEEGQNFARRVYINDTRYPALQDVTTWTGDESGIFEDTIQLGEDYGNYTVEYFVDGVLVQEGFFFLGF